MIVRLLAAATLVLALAACEQPPVTSAERSVTEEAVGTVREIDRVNRRFVLRIDGRTLTMRANEAVPAFDIMEVGDRVRVAYTEALAVDMATADESAAPETAGIDDIILAEDGIGRVAAEGVTAVVEFVGFDETTNDATLIGPEGETFTVDVAPEMRAFARDRVAGDLIRVTYAIAAAVSLEFAEAGG